MGDDEFYLLVPLSILLYIRGRIYITIMTSKKKSLLERGFVSPEGNIPCNADITNSLLHQNECVPKCYTSESTHSKYQVYVLWERKEKDDVSSE